ncbi:MAG: zinc-ribbon domain-containing protein, partial [Coriobacteriaceae bacterium]|nr:zinc-ribbon domain-containing protein [Coriobacteriaceae bacterium]
MFCARCGSQLPEAARFCKVCGAVCEGTPAPQAVPGYGAVQAPGQGAAPPVVPPAASAAPVPAPAAPVAAAGGAPTPVAAAVPTVAP